MLHRTFIFFLLVGILPFGQQQKTTPSSSSGGIRPRSLLLNRNGQPQLEQQVQASATKRQFGSRTTLTTLRPASTAALPTLVTTASQRAFTGRPGCQLDIVLLVDMSGGALDKRERYLGMAAELIRALDVDEFGAQVWTGNTLLMDLGGHKWKGKGMLGANQLVKSELWPSLVALVRYSGKGRTDTVFRLKNRYNQTRLLDEIANAQPLSGTTRTREAMLHAKREFERKFGGREKADRVLIVFTDGYSQDDPSDIATELRRERIHVFAVAVEDQQLTPNVEQLKTIASDPQSIVIGAAQFGILKNKVAQPRCRQ